jgi:MSHA pilin protein MshA
MMKLKEYKVEKNRIQGFKGSRGQVKTLQYEHLNPRILEPLNPRGMTLIEVIVVMVIIGILAATVLPKIDFGGTSSTASAGGAAYMIASDIRYTQECAMASLVSKSISFTSGQSVYTFPATIPSTSSLDPTGRLPSGVTIGTTITFTFNSLGEPTAGGGSSFTVSTGGITRTITVTQYTGKVSIS